MKKLLVTSAILLVGTLGAMTLVKTNDLPIPDCGYPGQPDCPACACDSLSGWAYIRCVISGGCHVPAHKVHKPL